MAEQPSGIIIWQRTIDHDAIAARRRQFVRWFCLPVVAIAFVIGVAAGPWSALGLLIFFGLFGLLLGGWVYLDGRNRMANPVLTRDGDVLRINQRMTVPIGQVVRWTTFARSAGITTNTGGVVHSPRNSMLHVAAFHLEMRQHDGTIRSDEAELVWPLLTDDDKASLRTAIERELPDRWVPLATYRSPQ